MLRLSNLKTRTAINAESSVFVICIEAITYLILCNLHDCCTFKSYLFHITSVIWGKRVNLKTGVSRKQSTPNFPKNEHFLPPDAHTYAVFVFQKIWRALFSWITSFAFWDSSFCLITDKISIMVILGWDNSDKTYLFKVYARNTIKRCEIWSKLTIKTPERHAIPPENVRKPKV